MSEYEAREAAVFGHFNWFEFQKLPYEDKVYCVAHFRMNGVIKSHVDEIVVAYQKAHAPRPK